MQPVRRLSKIGKIRDCLDLGDAISELDTFEFWATFGRSQPGYNAKKQPNLVNLLIFMWSFWWWGLFFIRRNLNDVKTRAQSLYELRKEQLRWTLLRENGPQCRLINVTVPVFTCERSLKKTAKKHIINNMLSTVAHKIWLTSWFWRYKFLSALLWSLYFLLSRFDHTQTKNVKCIQTSLTSACPVKTFSHISAILKQNKQVAGWNGHSSKRR